jgi:hypothetical protein
MPRSGRQDPSYRVARERPYASRAGDDDQDRALRASVSIWVLERFDRLTRDEVGVNVVRDLRRWF